MFEAFTYEVILEDMLSRVTNDVDKREGSIIYDALAPTAFHLAQTYFYLDAYLDLLFADTAGGEFLDRIVTAAGITRKEPVYAVRRIVTSGPVAIGTRWAIDGVMYTIEESLSTNNYSATCMQAGSIGNTYSGILENIDNVSGVAATLTDILVSGEDQEADDALRTRYFDKVQAAGTSGNIHDYRKWALEVPGCNGAKVYPLWDGPGTVKVLVVDENMQIDVGLPTIVAAYIEEKRPIGATVTVVSPENKAISVTANVVPDGSKTLAEIQTAFMESLAAYLSSIVFDTYSVSYARIGSLLLSTVGVEDYNTLLINGGAANVTIDDDEIPEVGTVMLTEV